MLFIHASRYKRNTNLKSKKQKSIRETPLKTSLAQTLKTKTSETEKATKLNNTTNSNNNNK